VCTIKLATSEIEARFDGTGAAIKRVPQPNRERISAGRVEGWDQLLDSARPKLEVDWHEDNLYLQKCCIQLDARRRWGPNSSNFP